MPDETVNPQLSGVPTPQMDPAQVRFAVEQLRSQQNLVGGVLAGLTASLAGAGAWAGITVATGYQIGWMAVGVGFLVGFAVRIVGKGLDKIYGIFGATLAMVGCAAGNLLAVCGLVAKQESTGFMEVLSRLDLAVAQELMVATFSPIDLLFYGIAVYEGYRLSFRQLSQQELSSVLPGR